MSEQTLGHQIFKSLLFLIARAKGILSRWSIRRASTVHYSFSCHGILDLGWVSLSSYDCISCKTLRRIVWGCSRCINSRWIIWTHSIYAAFLNASGYRQVIWVLLLFHFSIRRIITIVQNIFLQVLIVWRPSKRYKPITFEWIRATAWPLCIVSVCTRSLAYACTVNSIEKWIWCCIYVKSCKLWWAATVHYTSTLRRDLREQTTPVWDCLTEGVISLYGRCLWSLLSQLEMLRNCG